MKVLKFGGTSVGSSENINKIIEIISKNEQNDVQAVVVSAFSRVTNLLLEAAHLSASKKSTYTAILNEIRSIHLNIIMQLIPKKNQQEIIAYIEKELATLEQILQSISLINELSYKSEATIVSYGELLSSYIITYAMQLKKSMPYEKMPET